MLPSTHGTTPRKRDDYRCVVYKLMFMWRIANGEAPKVVGHGSTDAARGMIATLLWKGSIPDEIQHRVH